MKPYFQTVLLTAIILFSANLTADVYALSASGSGSISFDGTGTIIHMQSPFTIIDVFGPNCTPSTVGDLITRCNTQLDTSLLGSGITRAEDVSIFVSPSVGTFNLSLGGIHVGTFDPLTDAKREALQALIDQEGPAAIHMSLSLSNGSMFVSSTRSLVQIDVKPGNADNRLNPHSRGFLPVAILTTTFFNASAVNVDTIEFGISGHEISPTHAVLQDVDGDGDVDLLLFFRVPDTGLQCGTLFTYLRGELNGGLLIAGYDSITTVGCD